MLTSGATARLVAEGDLVDRDADDGTHPQHLSLSIVAHQLTLEAIDTCPQRFVEAFRAPFTTNRRQTAVASVQHSVTG